MNRLKKFRVFKNPILFGLIVFVVILTLTQFLTYQRYLLLKNTEQQEIISQANWVEKEFQKILNQSFSTTQTLAFIVENYGIPNNFDSIAKLLLQTNKNINALELVDSTGVITHVYPLEGNDILGFNILQDSIGKKGAILTIKRKDYFIAGPIHLKQGGDGFVSRTPIFKENIFKGFTAAVIKLPDVLSAIDINTTGDNRFAYQLAKINADKSEEIFFSSDSSSVKDEYSLTIAMSNGEWKLYIISKNKDLLSSIILFGILGLILSLLGGIFAWYILKQPSRLDKMVKEKTTLLFESQEKFYKSFHSNIIGKVIVDEQRNILEANDSIANTLETTRENLIGKKLIDADVLDFNSVEQTEKRKLLWDKVLEQGFLRDEEFTYTLKSGKKIPALLSVEPLKLENKTTFLVSAFDNTKRKEAEEGLLKSEERFRKLAATTPVGIFQSDESGACTYVNAEWLKYSGMEFDEAMGNGWINSTYTPDRERVLKEWEKTILEKKQFKSKFRLQHKKGKIITLSVKATPLFGLDKEVIGFIGMASDITSLIEVEQRLEAQNVELLKTNSELDRFVYSASHELRAPLASVLGLVDIILGEEKEAELVFKIKMIEKSVRRLDSFIKDIVQYSQNKHLEIVSEKIDFSTLINDSLESLWYLENRSQIDIKVEIAEQIDFYSDRKRISIVLNNLISNAIKYHNVEGNNPTINILVKTSEDLARIEVRDNGVGIPKEHLGKIFNMFYRVSSKVMGTGIGLFVVKEIVEKINGEIKVESEEIKGTKFIITIPNKL
tara:strand:+ start:27687 stop:30029 length:2343 start_codon:yes stop_codon:yes gene_type:complete